MIVAEGRDSGILLLHTKVCTKLPHPRSTQSIPHRDERGRRARASPSLELLEKLSCPHRWAWLLPSLAQERRIEMAALQPLWQSLVRAANDAPRGVDSPLVLDWHTLGGLVLVVLVGALPPAWTLLPSPHVTHMARCAPSPC